MKWAEEADNKQAPHRNSLPRSLSYGIGLLAANLAIIVFLYFKYDKERKTDWNGNYYRELPADATPAVIRYLMDYKIETRELLATLIDLVRKKHVEVQVVKQTGGLFHKEKTDYRFKLISEQTDGLRQHEELLILWFFKQLGQNNEFSLSDIRQYVNKKANAQIFALRYAEWKAKAVQEAVQTGYFETSNTGRNIAIVTAGVQFLSLIFFVHASYTWLAFMAIPLFLYSAKIKRRTKTGATERAKWRAFRRFLHDYSRMESREPMAVHLWEHYFVYAISLGVAKKMIGIANIGFREVDHDHHAVYGMATDGGFDRHFDHFAESFDKTVSAAQSKSSSRGSGGGFSSGGGGGGGGGGRGAF